MSTAHSTTESGIRSRVIGIVRGTEIDAFAAISLDGRAIVLAWEGAAAWRLDVEALDGVMPHANQLTLYLASGDVLELTDNDALRQFGQHVVDRACALPELTRGLRALGSHRGSPGPAHDKWFAPLLAALRSVSGISDPTRQVALIDAAQITQNMQRTLVELAREQSPDNPPMERALEAALLEESDAAFVALTRLALAADVLRVSTLDTRLVDWRRWVAALREVFAAADQCWPKCSAVLTHGL